MHCNVRVVNPTLVRFGVCGHTGNQEPAPGQIHSFARITSNPEVGSAPPKNCLFPNSVDDPVQSHRNQFRVVIFEGDTLKTANFPF